MAVLSVVPGPVITASPGNFLEMHILRPFPRTTDSESRAVLLRDLCFNKSYIYTRIWVKEQRMLRCLDKAPHLLK